jgi:hypothetical protein
MVHISPAIFDDLTGKIQFGPTEYEPLLDSEQGDDLEQLWDHPDTAQRDKKRSAGGQGRTSRATVRVGAPRTGLRPWGEKQEWWAWQVPNTHDRLARGQRLPERPEKAHSLGIFAFCCITRHPIPKAWGPSTASLSPLPTDSPSSP